MVDGKLDAIYWRSCGGKRLHASRQGRLELLNAQDIANGHCMPHPALRTIGGHHDHFAKVCYGFHQTADAFGGDAVVVGYQYKGLACFHRANLSHLHVMEESKKPTNFEPWVYQSTCLCVIELACFASTT